MLNNTNWDMPKTPSELPKTPSELMRCAADIMEQRGKARMAFIVTPITPASWGNMKMGSMCIQGALMSALGEVDEMIGHCSGKVDEPIYQKAMKILDSEAPMDENGKHSVVSWNNLHTTTTEQVVTKLRDTADMHVLEAV